MKRKLLSLLFLALLPLMASADAVQIDGIYYNLDAESKTAEVTSNPDRYKGDIVIPSSVKSGDVDYSVTSIGKEAFFYCWEMNSVSIPESVTTIAPYAFYVCNGLTSITIPNSVTSIGNNAFANCSNLTTVVLSDGLQEIPSALFLSCKKLESITIPKTITRIGTSAFKDCEKIESLVIPSSVTKIGSGIVQYCESLESIIVETENTVYDSRDNCNAIIETESNKLIAACQKTTIPEGVLSIGSNAFSFCNIASIVIPKSVTLISSKAFVDCPNLTSIKVEDGNSVFDSRENCNAIISTASNTLYLAPCKDFTIPSSVTTIGQYAFSYSNDLTSLTIPKTVTNISPEAFFYNTTLTTIKVEEGGIYDSRDNCNAVILTYANALIAGCSTTVIPSSVVAISNDAFSNNSELYSIKIPEGVTLIGPRAFNNCQKLASVYLPSTLETIETKAFVNCNSLTDVYCHATALPTIVEPDENFNRTNITLHVPESVVDAYQADGVWGLFKEIKGMNVSTDNIAFEDAQVKSLCVKNWDTGGDGELSMEEAAAVTDFGNVFYNKRINTFNEMQYFTGLTTIGEMAFHFSNITSVKFPTSLLEIGNMAFDETAIESIDGGVTKNNFVFPNHITTIRWEAFSCNPGIHSVKIPTSVTLIEPRAFRACENLKSFTIDEANPIYKMVDGWVIENGTTLHSSPVQQELERLVVSEGITEIAKYATTEYAIKGLKEVVLPASLKKIGNLAFGRLEKVICNGKEPAELEIEGNEDRRWYPFYQETFDEATLYVPAGTKEKYAAAEGWKEFKNIVETDITEYKVGDTFTVYGMTFMVTSLDPLEVRVGKGGLNGVDVSPAIDVSTEGTVVIPSSVTGEDGSSYAVTTIGAGAFSDCSNVTSVVIPNSVTAISGGMDWGDFFSGGAFQDCGLTSLVIPAGVTSIGVGAFAGCGNLKSIVVEEGNTKYDSRGNCNAIIRTEDNKLIAGCEKTVVPDGVTGIGACTFKNCSGLASLVLPGSLTSIGQQAFEGCSGLTSVVIPEGVTCIWQGTFNGCSSMTTMTIPKGMKWIGRDTSSGNFWSTFEGCESLTDVYCYAEEAPEVTASVFAESNSANATLYVPVGSKAKYEATDGWKAFARIVEAAIEEEVVYIPNEEEKTVSVETSDKSATEVEIRPEVEIDGEKYEVTSIGEGAFENNENLEKVSIPETIEFIGNNAFAGCTGLKEIRVLAEEPIKLGSASAGTRGDDASSVFAGVDTETCTLYVPAGSKEKYEQADGWKEFKNIVEMGETAAVTISISAAKQTTYCSDKDLDFTDKPELKAYVATGYDKSTGTIWLTRVKDVPANTGFLLMGDAGDYEVHVKEGGSDSYYKNLFMGTLTSMTLQTTDGANTNYYLSNGTYGVGFYKVTQAGGVDLASNRAYLSVPTDIPSVGTAGGTETINVGSALQMTYCSSNSLDFTDLVDVKAYTATGYNYNSGTIWLTRVKKVPAGTGILIMAPQGSYSIPKSSVASVYANMFLGTLSGKTIQTEETISGIDYINYYLSAGDYGVGFYKVTKEGGVSIGANRCYLPIPKRAAAAGTRGISSDTDRYDVREAEDVIAIRLFNGEDGAKGFELIENAASKMEKDVFYDLQGQRVVNPGKGLYIKNGRKVVIK